MDRKKKNSLSMVVLIFEVKQFSRFVEKRKTLFSLIPRSRRIRGTGAPAALWGRE